MYKAEVVVVRDLTSEDLGRVTEIHLAAFEESALSKLGPRVVRRYYEWLVEGPHDAARHGALVGDEIAGFCFGGIFRGAMSGFLRRNRVFLASQVMLRPWTLMNPIFRERIARATRILARSDSNRSLPDGRDCSRPFGILDIAVDPRFQGLGVGVVLMRAAEAIARERGFREMALTVRTDNHRAINFYEHLEWKKVATEELWDGRMIKPLAADVEYEEEVFV